MMGDPHNPRRAGETWNPKRISAQLEEIMTFHHLGSLSGGWAWHFFSPPGHEEIRTNHDHKDIDFFVDPDRFVDLIEIMKLRGFERAATQWDDPSKSFYRYVKPHDEGKIVLDAFVEDVPFVVVAGLRIVEPDYLVGLYRKGLHTSQQCLAVQAARKLLADEVSPIGRPELIGL